MFLKRVELLGFKSFAYKTIIDFENQYTGIVGPNGCGKSNIVDAIKWVLGEQSAKNMRGSSMSDVVFAGSEDKKGVNMAEVTLVFDNKQHYLNTDYEEVEITRRLYKNTNESEYLINKQICRLKDINDLILDTGLGRDSLSIISQGNIQSFAEAKPIERRGLFEEAAGVAKYKKRKIESLNKLERTQNNIDRAEDIVNELEKQVSPLEKAAHKAMIYKQKKERLEQIEVAVLVNDINSCDSDLSTYEQQLFDYNYQITSSNSSIQISENDMDEYKSQLNSLDSEIAREQADLMKVLDEIQALEKRKVTIDEKRKYLSHSSDEQIRVEQLRLELNEAEYEYTDRKERVEKANAALEALQNDLNNYFDRLETTRAEMSNCTNLLNNLNSRATVLKSQIEQPFVHQQAVKTVLDNRNVLPGIYDVVSNICIVDDGYQLAVTQALAGAIYHIVTEDENAAKNAISFLKKNKTGQATFLPLSVIRPHDISDEHLFIAENTNGFLGLASDFVDCEEKFDTIILSLLGNVLISEDLNSANELARRLSYQYKIVTLDGDIIYRGGSYSGGYNQQINSPLTLQGRLNDVNEQIAQLETKVENYNSEYQNLIKKYQKTQEEHTNTRVSIASLNEILTIKKNKYESLSSEYAQLVAVNEENSEKVVDEVVALLNSAYLKKDDITSSIQAGRTKRASLSQLEARKQQQLRQLRNELAVYTNKASQIEVEMARLKTKKDSLIERLVREYNMTYDFASQKDFSSIDITTARNESSLLRAEIAELGNVNLDAPQMFDEVNTRYTFLVKQLQDLIDSKNKILDSIDELDKIMEKEFMKTFDAINQQLDTVFKQMFGGGRARLFLEDRDDILNSGIDIDVQPPGKSIQNIKLFSGGEKSLIAICVLFAILKARVLPLCIFDEVEASLDENNVEKFAKYINQFSNECQFLVITHRPGTMAQCDVLYGVTMQQKGISKILKVKLTEAITYAQGE